MIKYKIGDLLQSDCNIICHQTNCQGVMGAGIAKQIRDTYPRVYERFLRDHRDGNDTLGSIGVCYTEEGDNPRYIVNMYAQDNYLPRGVCHTDYEAFRKCLRWLKETVYHYSKYALPKPKIKIGFPDHIGCGLAGGDWEIVKSIIEDEFERTQWKVEIWRLEK